MRSSPSSSLTLSLSLWPLPPLGGAARARRRELRGAWAAALNHDSKDYLGKSRPRSAVGIVDGLGMVTSDQKEDVEDKALRERHFPVTLAEAAFALALESSQASVQIDRFKILNTILTSRARAEQLTPISNGRYTAG